MNRMNRCVLFAVVVALAGLAVRPAQATLVGTDIEINVLLTHNLSLENPPTLPATVTVVSPGDDFGFQIDTPFSAGNPDNGLSVAINVEDSFIELTMFGSTSFSETVDGSSFTINLSELEWTGGSFITGATLSSSSPLVLGTVALGPIGPDSVSIVVTASPTFNASGSGGAAYTIDLELASTTIPEPATASLGLLALAGLMVRRRRAA